MKRLLLLLTVFLFTVGLLAQTVVSGDITGVWTATNDPYIITGDINVVDSLIIEPGVFVQFQAGGWQIEVGTGSKLKAIGTETDPIIFEPFQGQNPGSWNQIHFNNTGNDDVMEHCIIRYGTEGIYSYDSEPKINKCKIYGNLNNGIYISYHHSYDSIRVSYCEIFDNGLNGILFSGYDRYGTVSSTGDIYKCIIYNNASNGIQVFSGTYWNWGVAYAEARIINCTLFSNTNGIEAYAYRGYADATITNSIIAFNNEYGISNLDSRSFIGENDITYNCLWENIGGNYSNLRDPIPGFGQPPSIVNSNGDSCDINFNIYFDPLFFDTTSSNFTLQNGSKCIDAGTPIILGQYILDPDSTLPDIGAFYYDHVSTISEYKSDKPRVFSLYQNYPNPFNPATIINYQLPVGSHITLKVYDLLGREVATLVNEEKPPGSYEVEFNPTQLSSGIYFYKLHAGNFTATRKMVLIK